MTAKDQYNPVLLSSQDSDAAVMAMIDQMLAQDELYIMASSNGFHLCEKRTDVDDFKYYEVIDSYETRPAAYRGAIDCLIEACVFAWDQGDES